ncbi:MAG: hypothetical protein K0S44_2204 [Bacteroidetes bacterium]|nr:hypothetical protein [Bacteroidota bacterium]
MANSVLKVKDIKKPPEGGFFLFTILSDLYTL